MRSGASSCLANKQRVLIEGMPYRSELHLVVPGICGPLADTQTLNSSPVIDQWLSTLSRSLCLPSANNIDDVIAGIFGLKSNDDFPSAALTLLANDQYDAELFYMHADPVHLRADMDHAILTSSADLEISDAESTSLCEMLDLHFEQDGLKFFALNKDQWLVSSSGRICMRTTSLVEATGRNVNFLLPQGDDSSRWKQVLTEAQMLMHSHELNTVRENSGIPSINSLWFHGSGELPGLHSDDNKAINSVCSNSDILKGIAKLSNCDYLKLPTTADEYIDYLLSCEPGSVNVLHLSDLEHLVNYTDVSLWLNNLTALLDGWVYPLFKTANKNNIKMSLYPCNGNQYRFSKYDFLKFWRNDELQKHVDSY